MSVLFLAVDDDSSGCRKVGKPFEHLAPFSIGFQFHHCLVVVECCESVFAKEQQPVANDAVSLTAQRKQYQYGFLVCALRHYEKSADYATVGRKSINRVGCRLLVTATCSIVTASDEPRSLYVLGNVCCLRFGNNSFLTTCGYYTNKDKANQQVVGGVFWVVAKLSQDFALASLLLVSVRTSFMFCICFIVYALVSAKIVQVERRTK